MNIQIFEKPPMLHDITMNSMPAINDVWLATNSAQIAVLQSYLSKLYSSVVVTGMFDQNTFKKLVSCVNSRTSKSDDDPVYLSYPEVPTEVMARESGAYLQRVIRTISNNTINCDGLIGTETINALNALLCDNVLTEISKDIYKAI